MATNVGDSAGLAKGTSKKLFRFAIESLVAEINNGRRINFPRQHDHTNTWNSWFSLLTQEICGHNSSLEDEAKR
jgi:hypothetical protein